MAVARESDRIHPHDTYSAGAAGQSDLLRDLFGNPFRPARFDSDHRTPTVVAIAEGIYSNLFLVSHSASEFVVDFARILPGPPKGKVQARIVMTPTHVKSLVATLQENLSRYERNFGPVPPFGGPGMPPQEDF